jgi:hypothetical protein
MRNSPVISIGVVLSSPGEVWSGLKPFATRNGE